MEWGEAIDLVQSKDCGRYAVATRSIHAGEQVLLTAPYTLTFNPNMYVSAIHLNAKASDMLAHASVSSTKCKKQHDKEKGKNKTVHHSSCNKENELSPFEHSSALKNIINTETENLTDYNIIYSILAADDVDAVTVGTRENIRTTMTTYCTCCFKEIPVNTVIANSSQLEQIAQDMSVERDYPLQSKYCTSEINENISAQTYNNNFNMNTLTNWETNTNALMASNYNLSECHRDNMPFTSKTNFSRREEELEKVQQEEQLENWEEAHCGQHHHSSKAHDKAYNKMKKPSRSTKMKSDAAVALKERLQEQAIERRAESIRQYFKAKKERYDGYVANSEQIELLWNELMTSQNQPINHSQNIETGSKDEGGDKIECDNTTSTPTTITASSSSSPLKMLSDYYNLECKAKMVKLFWMLKQMYHNNENNANQNHKNDCATHDENNEESKNIEQNVDANKMHFICTSINTLDAISPVMLVGCPCCGIACFCSLRCWFRQCRRHMESGECALLRHLYFELMEFYYTTPQSASRGYQKNQKKEQRNRFLHDHHHQPRHNGISDNCKSGESNETSTVQLIGSEPLSWNTNINSERALEAQCILQVSQVLVQSALEGYRGSWDSKYAKRMEKKEHCNLEKMSLTQERTLTSTSKDDCDTNVNEEEKLQLDSHKEEEIKTDKLQEKNCGTNTNAETCHFATDNNDNDDDTDDDDTDDIDLMDACVAHSLMASKNACNQNGTKGHHVNKVATKMTRQVECLTPLAEYLSPFSISSARECDKLTQQGNKEHKLDKPFTFTPTLPMEVNVQIPSYVDLACLVSNLDKMPKEHGRLFGRYYRTFYKHFQHIVLHVINTLTEQREQKQHQESYVDNLIKSECNKMTSLSEEVEKVHLNNDEKTFTTNASGRANNSEVNDVVSDDDDSVDGEEEMVSEEFFSRLGATAQCNSFGVYTSSGESIAFGFYPFASYFNHSCKPNLCRVMYEYGLQCASFYAVHDIAAQEPLTICYIDVEEENSAIRRQQLMASYRFHCECERCAGSASLSSAAQPVELCTRCHIHGYMRSRECSVVTPTTSAITTTCLSGTTESNTERSGTTNTSVQIRECTVCRRRVMPINNDKNINDNPNNQHQNKNNDDNDNVQ